MRNAAEGCIRKLEKGSSRNMIKTGAPNILWDHYIELEGLVRSHNAHDMYMLDGEVPETIMMGQTDDICNICDYTLYTSYPGPQV